MKIRTGTIEDAAAISELVYSLSAKYIAVDFDDEGARNLLASMETTAIEGYLTSGFRYHIAEENGIILGVVGVQENKHLYHLFVTESRQKQGLATELWRVAREACIAAGNPGEFTVNSSRLVLPFYKKLGFVEAGPPENRGGVIATPMKLTENEPHTSHKRPPKSGAAQAV